MTAEMVCPSPQRTPNQTSQLHQNGYRWSKLGKLDGDRGGRHTSAGVVPPHLLCSIGEKQERRSAEPRVWYRYPHPSTCVRFDRVLGMAKTHCRNGAVLPSARMRRRDWPACTLETSGFCGALSERKLNRDPDWQGSSVSRFPW
ncbi:hypothetical protein F5144DRAFT_400464 [Chaetomium tenue]|uniref:Uncharacterized protein n=1 Tax=Chaetomium tenue TaxID=1854479 RepID=A0ACB7NVE2_9PEZI|nr:hypothetical protein F5144DRAFT_400464 [Chaetomium globosum]